MKEAKPKALARITKHQLDRYRQVNRREDALSEQLIRVGMERLDLWREMRKAYKLDLLKAYYIDTTTGEVFESWPEV